MPVNRKDYQSNRYFTEELPSWICSTCGSGTLALRPKSLKIVQNGHNAHLMEKEEFFEPESISNQFFCIAECTNKGCQETSFITGYGSLQEYIYEKPVTGESGHDYENLLRPRSIFPPPSMITLSPHYPTNVNAYLKKSFELYWVDFQSCVNTLRCSIECALTDLGVKRFKYIKRKGATKRSRVPLTLHDRIKLLPDIHSDAKELLTAAKWIGNSGSHDSESLKDSDVFDTIDLIEAALNQFYDKSKESLKKKAKKINRRKKPMG